MIAFLKNLHVCQMNGLAYLNETFRRLREGKPGDVVKFEFKREDLTDDELAHMPEI